MVTANDLLKSITNSEAEGHIVIGNDRHVTVPASLKRIAVQYDHNIETVTFDCPRYWDNIDMSKMSIYVNYMRSDGYADSYPVTNVTVDNNIMHFNWTISRNVTEVKGPITFLVCVKKTDAEGNEVNHWNSELCQDMFVSEGMETEEQISDLSSDLVTQLLLRMDSVEQINVQASEMQNLLAQTEAAKEATEEARDIALDESDYIKNSYANAFKGGASGEIIRVDDVSPIEHDVKCYVHGKNLVNVEYIDGESSSDRSIIQKDGNTIIFPALDGNVYGLYMNNSDLGLRVGKTYTASIGNVSAFDSSSYGWRIRYTDGTTATLTRSNTVTFTVEKEIEKIIFRVGSPYQGNTESRIENIQIEEGSVVTAYEPYIDPSTVTVTACGKNIFPYPYNATTYANGITFKDNGDGSITLNGVNDGISNSVFYLTKDTYITLPAGTYSCSPNVSGLGIMGVEKGGGYFTFCSVNKTGFILSEPKEFRSIYIQIAKGATNNFNNVTIRPMLEYSDVQSTFASYVGSTAVPGVNGKCSIKSVSPTTTIFTNTPGVTVEAEYNRDTSILNTVYIGSGDMPSGYNIHINPDGSAFELPEIDQTYDPESENAQSGIAVAEAVNKPWQLIENRTLEEPITQLQIDKEQYPEFKEIHIEARISPTDKTLTTQIFYISLSGYNLWHGKGNPKSTGEIYLMADIYLTPDNGIVCSGNLSDYFWTTGVSNYTSFGYYYLDETRNYYTIYEASPYIRLKTETADGMGVGTKIRIWGR